MLKLQNKTHIFILDSLLSANVLETVNETDQFLFRYFLFFKIIIFLQPFSLSLLQPLLYNPMLALKVMVSFSLNSIIKHKKHFLKWFVNIVQVTTQTI